MIKNVKLNFKKCLHGLNPDRLVRRRQRIARHQEPDSHFQKHWALYTKFIHIFSHYNKKFKNIFCICFSCKKMLLPVNGGRLLLLIKHAASSKTVSLKTYQYVKFNFINIA